MDPIIKKVILKAPAPKVWEALTEVKKLSEWMMMPADVSPAPGGEFTFQAEKSSEWDGLIRCRVKDMVENKKLMFTWNSNLLNCETLVSIDLVHKAISRYCRCQVERFEMAPSEKGNCPRRLGIAYDR